MYRLHLDIGVRSPYISVFMLTFKKCFPSHTWYIWLRWVFLQMKLMEILLFFMFSSIAWWMKHSVNLWSPSQLFCVLKHSGFGCSQLALHYCLKFWWLQMVRVGADRKMSYRLVTKNSLWNFYTIFLSVTTVLLTAQIVDMLGNNKLIIFNNKPWFCLLYTSRCV